MAERKRKVVVEHLETWEQIVRLSSDPVRPYVANGSYVVEVPIRLWQESCDAWIAYCAARERLLAAARADHLERFGVEAPRED